MRPRPLYTAFCALLLAMAAAPGAARAQVFTGEGTAVLGSSMTPDGTRRLAFEKARQSALEKFGTHVVSKQTIATIQTPGGLEEVSRQRVSALAAGVTHLVEGSKTVRRSVTEAAIVYRVTARFKIEPTDFEETLRAYLETGRDSPLDRSVEDVIDVQERISTIDPEATRSEEIQDLLARTDRAYENVSVAVQQLDGRSIRSRLARERRRRTHALLRYLRVVNEHGYPPDLLRLNVARSNVQDQGRTVQLTYHAGHALSRNAHDVLSACRETRPTWAPDDDSDGSPSTDGWLEQTLGGTRRDFSVWGPILLYLLDGDGNVLLVVAKTSKGMMSPPSVQFTYGACARDRFFDTRLWSDAWTFRVPTRLLREAQQVVLALSKPEYRDVAGRHDFRAVERGIYASRPGQNVGLDRFLYPRDPFESLLDAYAEKAQAAASTP